MTPGGFGKGRNKVQSIRCFLKNSHSFSASLLNPGLSVRLTCIIASLLLVLTMVCLQNLSAAEFLVVGLGIIGYKKRRCNATEI
jgi:hypothetical protein